MDCEYNVSILPYGEEWRQHRKICQSHFNARAAQNYEPIQTKKVQQLLRGLLGTPKEFDMHNKMHVSVLTYFDQIAHRFFLRQVLSFAHDGHDVWVRGEVCR